MQIIIIISIIIIYYYLLLAHWSAIGHPKAEFHICHFTKRLLNKYIQSLENLSSHLTQASSKLSFNNMPHTM